MTAVEKAKELVTTFTWQRDEHEKYVAKEMAKSCADEVIAVLDEISIGESGTTKIDFGQSYWNAVKEEITKL